MKVSHVLAGTAKLNKVQAEILRFLQQHPDCCLGFDPKADGDQDAQRLIDRLKISLACYDWSLCALKKKGYVEKFYIKRDPGRGRKRAYFALKGSEAAAELKKHESTVSVAPEKEYPQSVVDLDRAISENPIDCADWDNWKERT